MFSAWCAWRSSRVGRVWNWTRSGPTPRPMDLSRDDRKRLRDLAGECGIELCAVSPNCDLSSPVPVQREAMIGYVRECIKLARSALADLQDLRRVARHHAL